MNFELNNLEQLEQISEVQKAQQLETEPPKLDRTVGSSIDAPSLKDCLEYSQIYTEGLEIKEKLEEARRAEQDTELPPKLEKDTALGGTVMEMKLEMDKLKLEQLQKQVFGEGGKLGETREEFNRRRAAERAENKIQLENRLEELEKAREEAERKKQEYHNSLYHKDD